MASYRISVGEEAKRDLMHYPVFVRKIITTAIREHLSDSPMTATRNRKKLRENPVATWELRAGEFRIFYEVEEEARQVTVVAVGHKEHDRLVIRGEEVQL